MDSEVEFSSYEEAGGSMDREEEARVMEIDPTNGATEKIKLRKNVTKAWFPVEVSTPNRATSTSEAILQSSPGVVTRRRLAVLMGKGTSSQPPTMAISTPTIQATPKKIAKKITPKKMKKA
ncbi:hypothetical protein E2562_012885 [Oryza meyeriana var. granulata]|uniref:Uncharacterized protein n=1 Tax=Oryza meyeriana var. granulata TaxID=110450 RepID=A0A6G1CPW5_9ORYZ|nr:hypothetical protein E2562_012885 [Oryza meyeriana var. granulata]